MHKIALKTMWIASCPPVACTPFFYGNKALGECETAQNKNKHLQTSPVVGELCD